MPIGRNQPLKQEKPKWKSDVPLTTGQLQSKRDEFWETAPAYEGRKEIWDALRGAATALESGDYVLAQAIIDGANISCPNGEFCSSRNSGSSCMKLSWLGIISNPGSFLWSVKRVPYFKHFLTGIHSNQSVTWSLVIMVLVENIMFMNDDFMYFWPIIESDLCTL